jgi:hypothetical protein
MKTEQLLTLLAHQSGPAQHHVVPARLAVAMGLGALASAVAAVGALGLNGSLASMGTALVIKLAYVIGLVAGGFYLADRVSRPGATHRRAAATLAGVVLAMAAVALALALLAPSDAGHAVVLGRSWKSCPWRVVALSLPALAALFWALRGLAPTRARLAGWVAGLLAGSLGALGYALYCPELSAAFVFVWYTLGILATAAIGALLGPSLLRW